MSEQIEKAPSQNEALNQSVPQENSLANDYDIDGFLAKRKEFIEKVNAIMVEKSDYHVIQGKKSLAKGGAEKIASIFGWTATFDRDTQITEAFVELKGLVAFVCNLQKVGQNVGQGRGASTLSKNAGDPNKTIKMAQKSAFIDAVLRASGLSDFFTQDLEDMNPKDLQKPSYTQNSASRASETPKAVSKATDGNSMTDKQNKYIHVLMKQKGVAHLSDIGIEKIDKPTMLDAKTIIDKLLAYEPTENFIQLEEPLANYVPNHEGD